MLYDGKQVLGAVVKSSSRKDVAVVAAVVRTEDETVGCLRGCDLCSFS